MPGELDLMADRARRGEERAFQLLAERIAPHVQRIAWRILGDEGLAADALQDVLLKLLRGLPRYDPNRSFEPWLDRIVVRTAIDLHRRETVLAYVPLELAGEVPSPAEKRPDETLLAEDAADRLQELATDLSHLQRTVFVLRDLEGWTTTEIAHQLEMAASTVRVHLARARRRIREAWQQSASAEVEP